MIANSLCEVMFNRRTGNRGPYSGACSSLNRGQWAFEKVEEEREGGGKDPPIPSQTAALLPGVRLQPLSVFLFHFNYTHLKGMGGQRTELVCGERGIVDPVCLTFTHRYTHLGRGVNFRLRNKLKYNCHFHHPLSLGVISPGNIILAGTVERETRSQTTGDEGRNIGLWEKMEGAVEGFQGLNNVPSTHGCLSDICVALRTQDLFSCFYQLLPALCSSLHTKATNMLLDQKGNLVVEH